MNDKFLNVELNFELNLKKRIIKYKLEGIKRPIGEKDPQHLSLKYIGKKECNFKRGKERDFPIPKVLPVQLQSSQEKLKKEKKSEQKMSIDSLLFNENNNKEEEEFRHKKNKSELKDYIKSNQESKGKIIIITDKDFHKKKHKKNNSDYFPKENKTQKNFFENDILAPIEIKNLKNLTVSNFKTINDNSKKKYMNIPIRNTFIKERALSFHEKQIPERYNSNVSFVNDTKQSSSKKNGDYLFGKKVNDFTRSNVHLEGIMSRIIGNRNKYLINSNNNQFNQFIKIQNINSANNQD